MNSFTIPPNIQTKLLNNFSIRFQWNILTLSIVSLKKNIMKKIFVLLMVLSISVCVFARLEVKQVLGLWEYTVTLDQDDMTGTLKFYEIEGKLTGEVITRDGGTFKMTKVELKDDDILYFELQPEYDVIKVSVKVEGEKAKGTVSSYQGEAPLTLEKLEVR